MNIKLIWLGEERIIPGIAHVTEGSEFRCPKSKAESFISQGLAMKKSQSKKASSKQEK